MYDRLFTGGDETLIIELLTLHHPHENKGGARKLLHYDSYPNTPYISEGGANMHGCCGSRGFLTKEEKLEMLKEYKDSLDKETKGVEERIKELQKN